MKKDNHKQALKNQYIKDKSLYYEYKVLSAFEIILNKLLDKVLDKQMKIETPSNYDSIYEYSEDKNDASFYIYNNRKVPKQLAKKLIRARRQLERRGVLEPFVGADYL